MITKLDKGNGVVILDGKPYDNAIQQKKLDISQFKKLDEDPSLKRESLLQRFLDKFEKTFFNENLYDKL